MPDAPSRRCAVGARWDNGPCILLRTCCMAAGARCATWSAVLEQPARRAARGAPVDRPRRGVVYAVITGSSWWLHLCGEAAVHAFKLLDRPGPYGRYLALLWTPALTVALLWWTRATCPARWARASRR